MQGTRINAGRGAGLLLTIGGAIGLIASFILTVDKIRLLQDPNYVPGCSLNPTFSCGSVMTSWQAALFGFPNALIGLIGFAVVTTLGVLVLSGLPLPRWIWWGLQIGTLAAAVFVHWLIFQSLFDIGALCLYCMAVWAVTIPLFAVITAASLAADPSRAEPDADGTVTPALSGRLLPAVVVVWWIAIAVTVILRFG